MITGDVDGENRSGAQSDQAVRDFLASDFAFFYVVVFKRGVGGQCSRCQSSGRQENGGTSDSTPGRMAGDDGYAEQSQADRQ